MPYSICVCANLYSLPQPGMSMGSHAEVRMRGVRVCVYVYAQR